MQMDEVPPLENGALDHEVEFTYIHVYVSVLFVFLKEGYQLFPCDLQNYTCHLRTDSDVFGPAYS